MSGHTKWSEVRERVYGARPGMAERVAAQVERELATSSEPDQREADPGHISMVDAVSNVVVPATTGPAELAPGHAYVGDLDLEGDEDLQIGMHVEVHDDAGALFAATVTGYQDHRWQLTLRP